ncbi:MAG: hypothetical protein Q9163_004232 [Psora crenata]
MEHQPTLPGNHDVENAPRGDRLSIFREEVGITAVRSPLGCNPTKRPSSASSASSSSASARNIGVYQRVISAEQRARIQYYASASLINSCLLLQIVLAATITSLGAANGSHMAITGVGAANTVIAGLLSFTKGQGLPTRLLQYQNALRKVREYIEQRERDFAQVNCSLDLEREVRAVVDMYESVRCNDEANDPNSYHHSPDVSAAKATPPAAARGEGSPGHRAVFGGTG